MRVKTCCGCMSLQTGSIVLASLSLISSIISTILIGVNMNRIGTTDVSRDTTVLIKSVFVGFIVYLLIVGGLSGLMIFGSLRRNAGYVFPWIALVFSGLVYNIGISLAFLIHAANNLSVGGFFGVMAFIVPGTALQIYFWLIVYSHYKDLLAVKYGCQKNPNNGEIFSDPMKEHRNV